ncbi:hypothetical protein HHK36_030559 [Tetracentron sinense]|uniref:BZIP domain-containing protein n=1 Tax=Tetracentron sinense TaxID=13715 RepID=A0A835D0S5_TETSI|nr:hypothetical protein HHK36_030559 [Tetracentron sinense]
MASSKVMASSTSANSDLARQSSLYSLTIAELQTDPSKNFGSMSMDELLKNIYGDNPAAEVIPEAGGGDGEANGGGVLSRQGSVSLPKNVGNKTVEEVWKEISAGGGDRELRATGEMTLEDFLTMAGAVREEDVRISAAEEPGQGIFAVNSMMNDQFQQQQQQFEGPILGFGNGVEGGGRGRGKRRALQEPIDRVAQQRQRRMIKNRESAARSRERKQAYTNELETIVTQLEQENARLVREQVLFEFPAFMHVLYCGYEVLQLFCWEQQMKERFKQPAPPLHLAVFLSLHKRREGHEVEEGGALLPSLEKLSGLLYFGMQPPIFCDHAAPALGAAMIFSLPLFDGFSLY